MQRLDLTLPSPAENLAADEALLDACEDGQGEETLVFWEPREPFVVLGYANKAATEVNLPVCAAKGIQVLRRCSGGGTVVQLPGGLNYSLILRITETGPTRNISAANQFIMEKNRVAVQAALGDAPIEVAVRGHTDLAVAPAGSAADQFLKVAGNSQRRRRRCLLFHGTFLLRCDLQLISELLRMPSLQPDYRAARPHSDFVTNLNLPPAVLKEALARVWNADAELTPLPAEAIARLVREKYATPEWNQRF